MKKAVFEMNGKQLIKSTGTKEKQGHEKASPNPILELSL